MADTRLVYLSTEIIAVRVECGEGSELLAIAEANL
jgi:hypothetical protein